MISSLQTILQGQSNGKIYVAPDSIADHADGVQEATSQNRETEMQTTVSTLADNVPANTQHAASIPVVQQPLPIQQPSLSPAQLQLQQQFAAQARRGSNSSQQQFAIQARRGSNGNQQQFARRGSGSSGQQQFTAAQARRGSGSSGQPQQPLLLSQAARRGSGSGGAAIGKTRRLIQPPQTPPRKQSINYAPQEVQPLHSLLLQSQERIAFSNKDYDLYLVIDGALGLPLPCTVSRIQASLHLPNRDVLPLPVSAASSEGQQPIQQFFYSDWSSEASAPQFSLKIRCPGHLLQPSMTLLCRLETLEAPRLRPVVVGHAALRLCIDRVGMQPLLTSSTSMPAIAVMSDPQGQQSCFFNQGQFMVPLLYGPLPASLLPSGEASATYGIQQQQPQPKQQQQQQQQVLSESKVQALMTPIEAAFLRIGLLPVLSSEPLPSESPFGQNRSLLSTKGQMVSFQRELISALNESIEPLSQASTSIIATLLKTYLQLGGEGGRGGGQPRRGGEGEEKEKDSSLEEEDHQLDLPSGWLERFKGSTRRGGEGAGGGRAKGREGGEGAGIEVKIAEEGEGEGEGEGEDDSSSEEEEEEDDGGGGAGQGNHAELWTEAERAAIQLSVLRWVQRRFDGRQPGDGKGSAAAAAIAGNSIHATSFVSSAMQAIITSTVVSTVIAPLLVTNNNLSQQGIAAATGSSFAASSSPSSSPSSPSRPLLPPLSAAASQLSQPARPGQLVGSDIGRQLRLAEEQKAADQLPSSLPPLLPQPQPIQPHHQLPALDERYLVEYSDQHGVSVSLDRLVNLPDRGQQLMKAAERAAQISAIKQGLLNHAAWDNKISYYKTTFRYLPGLGLGGRAGGGSKGSSSYGQGQPSSSSLLSPLALALEGNSHGYGSSSASAPALSLPAAVSYSNYQRRPSTAVPAAVVIGERENLIVDDASLKPHLTQSTERCLLFNDDHSCTEGIVLGPAACLLVVITAIDILTSEKLAARPLGIGGGLHSLLPFNGSHSSNNNNNNALYTPSFLSPVNSRSSMISDDTANGDQPKLSRAQRLQEKYQKAMKLRGLLGIYVGTKDPRAVYWGLLPLFTRLDLSQQSHLAKGSYYSAFYRHRQHHHPSAATSSSSSLPPLFVNSGVHAVPLFRGLPPDDMVKALDPLAWLYARLGAQAMRAALSEARQLEQQLQMRRRTTARQVEQGQQPQQLPAIAGSHDDGSGWLAWQREQLWSIRARMAEMAMRSMRMRNSRQQAARPQLEGTGGGGQQQHQQMASTLADNSRQTKRSLRRALLSWSADCTCRSAEAAVLPATSLPPPPLPSAPSPSPDTAAGPLTTLAALVAAEAANASANNNSVSSSSIMHPPQSYGLGGYRRGSRSSVVTNSSNNSSFNNNSNVLLATTTSSTSAGPEAALTTAAIQPSSSSHDIDSQPAYQHNSSRSSSLLAAMASAWLGCQQDDYSQQQPTTAAEVANREPGSINNSSSKSSTRKRPSRHNSNTGDLLLSGGSLALVRLVDPRLRRLWIQPHPGQFASAASLTAQWNEEHWQKRFRDEVLQDILQLFAQHLPQKDHPAAADQAEPPDQEEELVLDQQKMKNLSRQFAVPGTAAATAASFSTSATALLSQSFRSSQSNIGQAKKPRTLKQAIPETIDTETLLNEINVKFYEAISR